MTTERVLLFLDIDGVLHPVFPRDDLPEAENKAFCYRSRIENVLREFPSVQIVISSDWRKLHDLDQLRAFFSDDIGQRIVGVIGRDDNDYARGNRQRLVHRYIDECAGAAWLAIDDDDLNYEPGAPLVLCKDGFRDEEESALREALGRLSKS